MNVVTAYESVCPLIHRLAYKYSLPTFHDQQETIQEARLWFFKNYPRYDSTKAKLTTWTHIYVGGCIRSFTRKTLLHNKREETVDVSYDSSYTSNFLIADLFDELSDDATTVANLVLECPAGLQQCIEKKGNRKQCINVIRGYLSGMDWPRIRVTRAIKQIREAL